MDAIRWVFVGGLRRRHCLFLLLILFCLLGIVYATLRFYFDLNLTTVINSLHLNKACFASAEEISNIRHMLFAWEQTMGAFGLEHWIDHGSLLGAVRFVDVIPWDHDGDVGYLWKDVQQLRQQVIPVLESNYSISIDRSNPVKMLFEATQVDIFAYATYADLKLRLPNSKSNRTLTRATYRNSEFEEATYNDVEPEELFPTRWCRLANSQLRCPRNVDLILKRRYPYSFHLKWNIPYKPWCYLQPLKLWSILKRSRHSSSSSPNS